MEKQIVVHLFNETALNSEKEDVSGTCNNME